MITKVETNLKAGANVTLAPKTLIVGPNRAGKSTVVNAVELATTGRASDVAGRATLALDAELATLIPPGEVSGFARVWMGEVQLAWALTKGKKATRAAMPAPAPEVVFPLRDVRDNLTASPTTARKWLLGRLASETPWTNVLARIAPALHERLSTLAGSTVLGLPTAIETARKSARDATKNAEALRAAPSAAVAPAAPVVNPGELAQASLRLDVAQKKLASAKAALAAMPQPTATNAVATSMLSVLRGQIASKSKACGICTSTPPDGAFEKRLAQIEGALKATEEAAMKRQAAQAAVAIAENEAREATYQIERIRSVTRAVAETVDATAQANEARAVELDAEAATWTALGDAAERAMNALVSDARLAFEGRVQAFMPSGMVFGLDLMDGEREVTRFGLRQPDGSVRSALSGAEWAIVTVALAGAVTPPGAHAVVVPEERAFDAETLTAALRAFGNLHAQVIVTSPIMPTEVPEGWTVVAVGGPVVQPGALPEAPAQTAPPPPKRGRGRPRKAKPEDVAAPPEDAPPFA